MIDFARLSKPHHYHRLVKNHYYLECILITYKSAFALIYPNRSLQKFVVNESYHECNMRNLSSMHLHKPIFALF